MLDTILVISLSAVGTLGICKYIRLAEIVDRELFGNQRVTDEIRESAWRRAKKEVGFWWPFVKGEKSR